MVAAALWSAPAGAVTLEQAWTAAEDANVELRLAREQTRQAATLRWQALSVQMPKVVTQWNAVFYADDIAIPDSFYTSLRDQIGVPDGFIEPDPDAEPILLQQAQSWNGNVSLVQPILRAGAVPGWQAATRVWKAASEDEARARQQVRAAVAQAFYGLATARAAIDVGAASVAVAERQLQLARQQVDAGLADRRASLQAELALSRAKRDLLGAREQLVAAQQAFVRTTGLDPEGALELPEAFDVPDDLDAALEQALGTRADVVAATWREDAARRERVARDLGWVPEVDFVFSGLFDRAGTLFNPVGAQWRAGFQLNWTVFDGGLRMARSREQRSRAAAAHLVVEQRRQQVTEDVRVAWERLGRARQAWDAVQAEQALADENLTLAERGFEAGSTTFLDVETARVSRDATALAEVTERMNRDLAAVQLLLALGRL